MATRHRAEELVLVGVVDVSDLSALSVTPSTGGTIIGLGATDVLVTR